MPTKSCEQQLERLRQALELIADIAEASRTANSLPHIAKLAREAFRASKVKDAYQINP
jgi:hypothetical protein